MVTPPVFPQSVSEIVLIMVIAPLGNPMVPNTKLARLDGKSWNARSNKALLGNPDGTYVNESGTF